VVGEDGAEAAVLIDAGFGPVTLARRLRRVGLEVDRVRAVLLTHLDQDHLRPATMEMLLRHGIPMHLHRWHAEELMGSVSGARLMESGLVRAFDFEEFDVLEPGDATRWPGAATLRVTPVRLPHDRQGTSGFVIRWPARQVSLGYATDLGHVPDEMVARLSERGGVDLLAIESNYDPEMQLRSPRPMMLKRRIMGKLGHLSNRESFEAVRRVMGLSHPGRPGRVVLLHRSAQCNELGKVREVFGELPELWRRVTLSHQRRPTRWLAVRPPSPAEAARAAQLRWSW
jgi:phosphoribosyl 1,2-cyclic phosphodiesterase